MDGVEQSDHEAKLWYFLPRGWWWWVYRQLVGPALLTLYLFFRRWSDVRYWEASSSCFGRASNAQLLIIYELRPIQMFGALRRHLNLSLIWRVSQELFSSKILSGWIGFRLSWLEILCIFKTISDGRTEAYEWPWICMSENVFHSMSFWSCQLSQCRCTVYVAFHTGEPDGLSTRIFLMAFRPQLGGDDREGKCISTAWWNFSSLSMRSNNITFRTKEIYPRPKKCRMHSVQIHRSRALRLLREGTISPIHTKDAKSISWGNLLLFLKIRVIDQVKTYITTGLEPLSCPKAHTWSFSIQE